MSKLHLKINENLGQQSETARKLFRGQKVSLNLIFISFCNVILDNISTSGILFPNQ